MKKKEYFVSGIDTDCGKTYVTGLIASSLYKVNESVITSKLIQTGCKGVSEDIIEHRKSMNINLLEEDSSGLTCPYVFSFPASPHFAAEIDNVDVDINVIRESINKLHNNFEVVITEGAGGLMVPIKKNYHTIDYIRDYSIPLILVASGKLGSLNHTLLSLEICKIHNINLHTFIFNQMPGNNARISENTLDYVRMYLSKKFPKTKVIKVKDIDAVFCDENYM